MDYGYQYQSNEKGNLYFNFTDKSPDIYVFIQPPQDISQSIPSINLEAEHELNGIDETVNFLEKNKNQIMQILKGKKNPKS